MDTHVGYLLVSLAGTTGFTSSVWTLSSVVAFLLLMLDAAYVLRGMGGGRPRLIRAMLSRRVKLPGVLTMYGRIHDLLYRSHKSLEGEVKMNFYANEADRQRSSA